MSEYSLRREFVLASAASLLAVVAMGCGGQEQSKALPEECSIELPTFADDSYEIMLETFEGNGSQSEWVAVLDPVMGGLSTGSFVVDEEGGVGVLEGRVEIVPSLNGPGFIHGEGRRREPAPAYPDITGCQGLAITAKASNDYAGFRWSIGDKRAEGGDRFAFGYKTNWFPSVGEFSTQTFHLACFTNRWNAATGDPVVSCTEDSRFCIDEDTMRNPASLEVWAEGWVGQVRLEVKEIKAVGCSAPGASQVMV